MRRRVSKKPPVREGLMLMICYIILCIPALIHWGGGSMFYLMIGAVIVGSISGYLDRGSF